MARAIVAAILLTLLLFATSLLGSGEREIGPLETIQGIPYARGTNSIHVDEALAHADVYLGQPVFGKELVLKIEFIPTNVTALSVGVRENSFWLSYNKQPVTSTVTIPLTDKLQEPDQSVDIMFFAEGENPEWELVNLTAEVRHTLPTWPQFKDYARALLYRERAV